MNVSQLIKALEDEDAEDEAQVILGHESFCELQGVESTDRGLVLSFDCYCGYVI
jgi:hypothetical protein